MPERDGDFGSVATQFVGAAQDAWSRSPHPATPDGASSIESSLTADLPALPPTAAAAWPATTAGWCSSATRCPVRRCARGSPSERGSYWHAEAVEVVDASPDRIDPLCPIAGRRRRRLLRHGVRRTVRPARAQGTGGGQPAAAARRPGSRRCRGSDRRAGGFGGRDGLADPGAGGGRSRRPGRLSPLPQRRVGQRSALRAAACRHARRPAGRRCPGGRSTPCRARRRRGAPRGEQRPGPAHPGTRRATTRACSGSAVACGDCRSPRSGRRTATRRTVYSALVADWAGPAPSMTAWDLYGGAGAVRRGARRRRSGRAGRWSASTPRGRARARAGRRWPTCPRCGSSPSRCVGRWRRLSYRKPNWPCLIRRGRAPAARSIDLVAGAGVQRVIHIGCEAAAFARDIGLYRGHGYTRGTAAACSTRSR